MSKRPGGHSGFTLIELLVVVAILTLLISILVPSLGRAREQARATVCASDIRQLALGNAGYAAESGGRYCPGAPRLRTENLRRWHGVRSSADQPFDATRGPLVAYLGPEAQVRTCPTYARFVSEMRSAFERGNGGYGYNQAYLGRVLELKANGSYRVVTDLSGVASESVRRPADTLMFADAGFAGATEGVIEYSFAEPRFHPEYLGQQLRMDPSIHFRHRGRANVAWCDGHVAPQVRTFTWQSGLYPGDPGTVGIGWFGLDDDNRAFDLQ
jgi:prepilin-type processing-associated H-X9-DG protein/prepilin-type N-terminal cleavage/methylation domain-containing protein